MEHEGLANFYRVESQRERRERRLQRWKGALWKLTLIAIGLVALTWIFHAFMNS